MTGQVIVTGQIIVEVGIRARVRVRVIVEVGIRVRVSVRTIAGER